MAVAAVVVLTGLAGAGIWWFYASGAFDRALAWSRDGIIEITLRAGFRVADILVVGRQETDREDLLGIIGLSRGDSIFDFDPQAVKARIEALPWVRRARVERMLPATVFVEIEERHPLALWQNKGRFALIDHGGEVILRKGLERFSELLVVVGDGAPRHAARLLEFLGHEPDLLARVEAAIWVGDRRWNLRLAGQIDVRLPEKDAAGAWARLAEYNRRHKIFEKDIKLLDLRFPDRLIVRPADRPKKTGQET
jgi:cell division protein FtsQ